MASHRCHRLLYLATQCWSAPTGATKLSTSALLPRSNLNVEATIFFIMSGLVKIGSTAEWQSLLSDNNVVVADCTYASSFHAQCRYSFN